jgi:homoserine O-acetyltransferase
MADSGIGRVATEQVILFDREDPLVLDSGVTLAPVTVAYETYGKLNAERDNAVFVCHALTGDAHAAGHHGDPGHRGWWDNLIGPGRPVDTDRWFVICPNLLAGCQGSTGPSSTNPRTGRAYGLRFPLLTVRDLTSAHRRLLDRLGIARLHATIGGSLGGMQALQWSIDHPEQVDRAALICCSGRLSAENIAFSAVARAAIIRDPDFAEGDYLNNERRPDTGLALARMLAHITYLSGESMRRKFDRARRVPGAPMTLGDDFEVEHYLEHQAESFIRRFDPLSYLYLTRTMDYFDPFSATPAHQLQKIRTRFLLISFDTDWRFGREHSLHIARNLGDADVAIEHLEISSPWGHDSFLLEVPEYHEAVGRFLTAAGPTAGRNDLRRSVPLESGEAGALDRKR